MSLFLCSTRNSATSRATISRKSVWVITLQSAALGHEAYVRLAGQRPFDTGNRAHFLAIAPRLMRQILVEYAHSREARRRPQSRTRSFAGLATNSERTWLSLDDALNGLAKLDEPQGRIVEMRFFAGLSIDEIAEALDISASTVKPDGMWQERG